MNMRQRIIILAIVLVILTPAAALAFFKPSRVFLPELAGVSCPERALCIEETNRLAEARALVAAATHAIEARLGKFDQPPRFIFCSSQACFESFGFKKATAQTLGEAGTVVGPRGWVDHYLKHELIHQWQAQKIGGMRMFFAPEWIAEGMAYALSDDPRPTLAEPFQSYRIKFDAWYQQINGRDLVDAIKREL